MLVFKAWRKSPALTQETTPSQRRITRILSDAQQAAAREFGQNLTTVAELLSRGQTDRVVSMLPTEPWLVAQEALAEELLGELLDAGSRVTLPAIEKATLAYSFDRERPESSQWARQAAGTMISQITGEQRSVVRDIVSAAALGEMDWGDVARQVQGSIGLTTQQAGWVSNRYDSVYANAIANGLSAARAAAQARDAASRYQTAVHRYRANTIARTETMRAASEGRMQAWNQGITQGFIGPNWQKEWIPESDACDICIGLRGKRINIKDSFSVGEPPAHPNCRCDVILVPPKVEPTGADFGSTALSTLSTIDDLILLGKIPTPSLEELQQWQQAYGLATRRGDNRSFREWFEDVIEPDITVYAQELDEDIASDVRWLDFEDITDNDELRELTGLMEYDLGEAYQEALQDMAGTMAQLFDDPDWALKYPEFKKFLEANSDFAALLQDYRDGTLELDYMPQVRILVSTAVRDSHWGRGPYSNVSIYGQMFGRSVFTARRSYDIVQGIAYHELFSVKEAFQSFGFGAQINDAMIDLYRRNGMKRIELEANIDVGGYTWARFGYDWALRYPEVAEFYYGGDESDIRDGDKDWMDMLAQNDLRDQVEYFLLQARQRLSSWTVVLNASERAKYLSTWNAVIDDMAYKVANDEPGYWPSPAEIASIGRIPGMKMWPGKAVMLGSHWQGVYFL